MALVLATLQADLQALFASPPSTHAACAQAWADAMEAYAGAVVPASSTAPAAAAALSAALSSAFQAPPSAAAMETAFTAFGATLGSGMAGFVAVPPAGPVNFAPQFATNPTTHASAALGIATIIDTWMRTGTAAPISGGPAVPWS